MRFLLRRAALPVSATGVVLLLGACMSPPTPRDDPPARSMGVTKGPELVFEQPVESVMPALAGATPTGQNGRIGGELVFWSYRLQDSRDVLFVACAQLEGVDCAARTRLVCPAGEPVVLQSGSISGEVRKLECRAIAQAAPGDLRPNCADSEFSNPLVLELVSCP